MIGKRLKQARKSAGLTQEDLAERVSMDSTASKISHYENEIHHPPFHLVCQFADALKIPECWFYCRDDELAEVILAAHRKQDEFRLSTEEIAKLKSVGDGLERVITLVNEILTKRCPG